MDDDNLTDSSQMQATLRHLAWEQCYNARDLGGLPTTDGGQTRWRSVVRSDTLTRLTAQGRQAMLAYGVRTIIDLRGPQEVTWEPSPFATPTGDPAEPAYLNLPVEYYFPTVSALVRQATSRAEAYCIILDHYPDAMAAVMRAIVQAQPGVVVLHCHAGKDRTGMVAGLLLRLAGVPVPVIAADYAESQKRLWRLILRTLVDAGDAVQNNIWLQPTATAEMMVATVAHVDRTYGDVRGYLKVGGLTPDEIDRLAARLRA